MSVAYGTEFVFSVASIMFYLACLFVLCLYLLSYFTYYCNLRQQAFFINVWKFYEILGMVLSDNHFFYFVSFLILLIFIVRLLFTNFLNFLIV